MTVDNWVAVVVVHVPNIELLAHPPRDICPSVSLGRRIAKSRGFLTTKWSLVARHEHPCQFRVVHLEWGQVGESALPVPRQEVPLVRSGDAVALEKLGYGHDWEQRLFLVALMRRFPGHPWSPALVGVV